VIRTQPLLAIALLLLGGTSGLAQDSSAPTPPASTGANAPRPAHIPVERFAASASLSGVLISPLGNQVLGKVTVRGTPHLAVMNLASGEIQLFAPPERAEIVRFDWAGEHRFLVSFGASVRWWGDEAYQTRLFVYDLRDGRRRFVGLQDSGIYGDVVRYVDPSGEWLLLELQRSPWEYPSVFRAELATGNLKQVVEPVNRVWDWFADHAGVVRVGMGLHPDGWFMLYRKAADAEFQRTLDQPHGDREALLASIALAAGSDLGFLLSDEKTGRLALHRYDFAAGRLGELLFASETNDVDGYTLTEDGRSVLAVHFADDRARTTWLDPVMKARQLRLDAALPGRYNHIVSLSRDRERMVVRSTTDRDPGTYYYHAPAAGQLSKLGTLHEQIDPQLLAATTYTRYAARDGLEIPAYLTLPPGREPRALPLIVMPHGGPYGVRDLLGYDPEVQLLANRGYAVLQPNYRGSAGYGAAFRERGEGEWGRRMQDDLDDGVKWLAGSGVADPRRVCLVGSSYGGYAALWGATRNPEVYRCAASFAGVSDLGRQLKYQLNDARDSRQRKDWRETVQGVESFDLASVSPLQQVERLRVPVLVVHGDQDQVVPARQSSLYEAALRKSGKVHEYRLYAGEGHGLDDPANRVDWFKRLEAFLAKHNPAD
jgi:dipeptidyl aminopeptidase/acylaminoacyl peptidase